MYRDIPQDLLEIIEPIVAQHGLELVDARIAGAGGRSRLGVVLDTPSGDGSVTADGCAAVSREIGHAMDVSDLLPGSYLLEVSSPGVDRVLGREKDFERALGRRVAVETREPLSGRRNFRGELEGFDGREVRVRTESGPVGIPFEAVARAQAFYPLEAGTGGRVRKR